MRLLVTALFVVTAVGRAAAFELDFPVLCTVGIDCAVQHYVDRDPGTGAKDFRCGSQTYDGESTREPV